MLSNATTLAGRGPAGLQAPPPPRAAPSPQSPRNQQQSQWHRDQELIDMMLDGGDEGVEGILGHDHEQAMLALARGKQLTEPERTATYAAADNRTDNINKNLDALDLKTANLYTSHHRSKVDMMHVQARVLYQVIYYATSTELVDVEEGKTTRAPKAWSEVSRLTRKGSIKNAKDACAEVLGGSVAWRLCEIHVNNLLAKFSTGQFTLDAFMRAARKVICVRLSYSPATGLTPQGARITMRNMGVFDWGAIVNEAIAASADKLERNRARAVRLRALVVKMHSDASVQARIAKGMKLTMEQVQAQFPDASDYVPMDAELQAMLAPEERAREPTRDDPTGAVRAGLPAAMAAAAAAAVAVIAASATPSRAAPEAVAATPLPCAAAAAATARIAAVAAATTTTAVARRSKRVASAGERNGAGGSTTTAAAAASAAPTRRQRVAGPSGSSDGDVEDAEVAEPAAAPPLAAAASNSSRSHGIALVSAPAAAAADGVLALSAATLAAAANTATNEEALALPVFALNTRATSDLVVDYLTHVPPTMVDFVLRLLHRAAEVGPVMATDDFCYELAVAFDDASLLVDAIDQSGGHALAPNRVFIKRDRRLFGLGLGACFTSFAVLEHSSGGGGGGGGGGSSGSSSSNNNRAIGTTALVIFVDPEYNSSSTEPHAFELVYGDGLRKQLRHGTVLVSRPGGNPWRVEGVARGAGDVVDHKKLREVCFFASSEVACAVGSSGSGGGDDGGPAGRSAAVQDVIERLVTTGAKGRGDAVAMFASVV